MKQFLSEGEEKFKKLHDQYQLMDKKFEELSVYYCFDRKKTQMEEFFGDISQFCKDFEVCGCEGREGEMREGGVEEEREGDDGRRGIWGI